MALPTVDELVKQYKESGPLTAEQIVGLPTTTAPTSADSIQQIPNVQLPTTSPSSAGIMDAKSYQSGFQTWLDGYFKELETSKKGLEKEQQEIKGGIFDFLKGAMGGVDNERAKSMDVAGIDEQAQRDYFAQQKELTTRTQSLMQDFSTTELQLQEQIAAIRGSGASTPFIEKSVAALERQYAPKLNKISSQINLNTAFAAMSRDNFQEAQNFVNMAVDNFMADKKFELGILQTFWDMNTDVLSRIDNKYSEALSAKIRRDEIDYEREYNEKLNIGQLMIQLPSAGITFEDSLDDAYSKFARAGGNLEILRREQAIRNVGIGGGVSGGVDYAPTGLTEEQSGVLNQLGLAPHQQEIVSGIMSGLQPPITSIQRTPEITKILGGLSALGYDNTKAVQDWTSMQKRLQSMNSTQQLRLSQAIFALDGSTEQAERLYAEWQASGLPTGFSNFNRAALAVAARTPGEAGVAARTLVSHIEDMAAELAVIYRGGNSPTDQAFEAARKSLNEDWNPAQFAKNLELIRQNLRIRKNSLANSAQITGNIYNPEIVGEVSVFGEQPQSTDQFSDIFDSVVSPTSSSWIVNAWNNLFK